ncbi:MAG TPA: hypothetical protein VFV86_04535, partial [Nitrososphaeraceae archaeon]|nr:hypothetical protein [Nitrososphaeraceae archaeon]
PKQRVFNAKKILTKAEMTETTGDPSHKQKILTKSTKFGIAVTKFLLLTDQFDEVYENLEKQMNNYTKKYVNQPILSQKKICREKQWSLLQLQDFEGQIYGIINLQKLCVNTLSEVILLIYELFYIYFSPNKLASEYLRRFVGIKLTFYMNKKLQLIENTFDYGFGNDIGDKIGELSATKVRNNEQRNLKVHSIQQLCSDKIFLVLNAIQNEIMDNELIGKLNELVFSLMSFLEDKDAYLQQVKLIHEGTTSKVRIENNLSPTDEVILSEIYRRMNMFYGELATRSKSSLSTSIFERI